METHEAAHDGAAATDAPIHDESISLHIPNEHTSSVCTFRKGCFSRALLYVLGASKTTKKHSLPFHKPGQRCRRCGATTTHFCAECDDAVCRKCRAVQNGADGPECVCLDCCFRKGRDVICGTGLHGNHEMAVPDNEDDDERIT